jgi:hypothetical protein
MYDAIVGLLTHTAVTQSVLMEFIVPRNSPGSIPCHRMRSLIGGIQLKSPYKYDSECKESERTYFSFFVYEK